MRPVPHDDESVDKLRPSARGDHCRARRIAGRAGVGVALIASGPVVVDRAASARVDAEQGPAVVAFPGPGWGFASPETGLTFSGGDPGAVSVVGSRSGAHAGTLRGLRGRAGAIFVPGRPFEPGERVTVRTQAEVHGARGRQFSFRVARLSGAPYLKPDLSGFRRLRLGSGSGGGSGACLPRSPRLRTLPGLRPAGWCVSRPPTRRAARGKLLVTPRSRPDIRPGDQHGVMILSRSGRLLWYMRRPYVARDLKAVHYEGSRMLALYQWVPRGRSYYALLDRRYRTVMKIRMQYGYPTNLHELQLTREGTAYVSSYRAVWHAPSGRIVTDFVIQELDLPTMDVLFEWHALDHVPPSATYQSRPHPRYSWDYFHGNSIEPPGADGTIVVSARNTSAVYGIDRATGALRWTLGGKLDDFGLVSRHPRRQFCAQHDARPAPGGQLTLFDNGGPLLGDMRDCPVHRARTQRFRLDIRRRRAHLTRTIRSEASSADGAGLYVWASGSARRQPNGNMLINWGTTGRITEVAPDGRVVFAMQLRRFSYRAVRSPWRGLPTGRPAVEARDGRVWASWNGATEVRRWRVLAGRSRSALRRAGPPRRFTGLETSMRAPAGARYVAVEALDARGAVLGRSATERMAR